MREVLLAALVLTCGCGGNTSSGGSNQEPDGGKSGPVTVEVGVGQTAFESVAEGQRLELVMAPQTGGGLGIGFHFDTAVRTIGLDPSGAMVRISITRVRDGAVMADVTRQINLVADGDAHVSAGFRAVVPACYEVADEMLLLEGEVIDAGSRSGSDRRTVLGPELCPR